jgi:hypothetical protein
MDSGLATNNVTDIRRKNMTNSRILENVKLMDGHASLINNEIRIQSTTNRQGAPLSNTVIHFNYNKIKEERSVVNDSSQNHHMKSLKIFHQNIRGLRNKHDELFCHLLQNCPQILCLSEHYLNEAELQLIHFTEYSLGAKYCRQIFLQGWCLSFCCKKFKI